MSYLTRLFARVRRARNLLQIILAAHSLPAATFLPKHPTTHFQPKPYTQHPESPDNGNNYCQREFDFQSLPAARAHLRANFLFWAFKMGAEQLSGRIKASIAVIVGSYCMYRVTRCLLAERVPRLDVHAPEGAQDNSTPMQSTKSTAGVSSSTIASTDGEIACYDPSTMRSLGSVPVLSEHDVHTAVENAQTAHIRWCSSTFSRRRHLMRILQRWILEQARDICNVSSIDSGKAVADSAFGEVMVTLEKIQWLIDNGERYLQPERREPGRMMFYKRAWVEYVPVGVAAAIVPWNYPFHNVFNPLLANVFAGNAIVIKVSEWASWSVAYYAEAIRQALSLAGAPQNLVQIVTGYGQTGSALVSHPKVGKVTFVGSTEVGKEIMRSAADNLTPVVLELGGKDPVIVCDDADLKQVVPTSLRAAYQCNGQNCAGGERFIVQTNIYEEFVEQVVTQASQCRQGPALDRETDVGSMRMSSAPAQIDELVQDAKRKGARVRVGGYIPNHLSGQYYTPTVVEGVDSSMRIAKEEVFGPVIAIFKADSDEHAIAIANDCPFGLGANAFSRSKQRARSILQRVQSGMAAVNDFATTYMAQSLPFGGVKDSGFDRFAGPEGLRGCCYVKSYVEDGVPLARTDIPPPLQYPLKQYAFAFIDGLISLIYGVRVREKVSGLGKLLSCVKEEMSLQRKRRRSTRAASSKQISH